MGDTYTSDVYWAVQNNPGWHSIVVIEEISMAEDYQQIEEESPFEEPLDLKLIPYDKYWGDFFIHSKEEPKKNYYVD